MQLKTIPEDFIVDEIPKIQVADGSFTYFVLKKTNLTTEQALRVVAKHYKVKPSQIGIAGLKDKIAITTQLCSIKKKVDPIVTEKVITSIIGTGEQPISLGDLEGNEFEITIRRIKEAPKEIKKFKNLFGEQRFSKRNVEIGRAIIKKDFKQAIELITESDGDIEREVKEHLEERPTDYIGALTKVPKKISLLYVHAYQADIFNRLAESTNDKNIQKIPLVGFGNDNLEIAQDILKEEGITDRDFIIKEIPHLSVEGTDRDLFVEIKDLEINPLEDDDQHPGFKKCKVHFILPKGAYATVAIKAMFE